MKNHPILYRSIMLLGILVEYVLGVNWIQKADGIDCRVVAGQKNIAMWLELTHVSYLVHGRRQEFVPRPYRKGPDRPR